MIQDYPKIIFWGTQLEWCHHLQLSFFDAFWLYKPQYYYVLQLQIQNVVVFITYITAFRNTV